MDVEAGREQRAEEAEPLQVVHVQVREHDVELDRQVVLHRDAERPHTGARVEHQRVPALEPDLDTRRVAAVLHRVGAGRRDRTATAPHAGEHQPWSSAAATSQNTATTPCISPVAPSNGYAVASYMRRTPLYAVAITVWCAGRCS